MKRLLELPAADPLTERAQLLVRATGATVASEERLQRVRRSLDVPARLLPGRAWLPALAVVTCVGLSAAAGAGVASGWLPTLGAEAKPEAAAPLPAATAASRPPRAVMPAPATPEVAVASPAEALPAPGSRSGAVVAKSDVARVHDAAKALRRDGNPARALELLERSGARITGPLAEEAMALRLEALLAQRDARAAKVARAYLADYPTGRYRDLAQRALAAGRSP